MTRKKYWKQKEIGKKTFINSGQGECTGWQNNSLKQKQFLKIDSEMFLMRIIFL